ncbi:MAG: chromosomal replication initiator protein DnaA [Clostridia bacterium]|nr:chromosomal replication initiator protein DnaA [Clostridia bacterium]
MEDIVQIWQKVLELIKADLLEVSYKTWIDPIVPVHINETEIILQVPYEYSKTMIEERYLELIKNSLLYTTGRDFEIDIRVQDKKEQQAEQEVPSKQTKYCGLNQLYTFSNFVMGDSNILAHSATQAVAKACIQGTYCEYNPLFIFGNPGLGKTHLMQAAGHEVITKSSDKNVLYVTSEQFTNELINSIKENDNQKFRDKYRSVDLLMIDDIQFISNMPGVQKEFHHTFNDLYQNNKMIIISSDRPPKELHGIEERLITRFESGVMHKIESPDYETRIAILNKKAEQLNIEIPDDVYKYIATNITTSNRELEGAMKMVVSYHRLMKRDITLALAEEALKEFNKPSEKTITPELIIKTVEKYFSLNENSLKSNSKAKNIAYPRQVAMYIISKVLDKKLKEIGDCFGGKDHSTVIHAIRKIEEDMSVDENKKSMIDDLIKDIKN